MPRGFLGRKGEAGAPSGDKQKGEGEGRGEKTRKQKKTFCRDNVGEFLPPLSLLRSWGETTKTRLGEGGRNRETGGEKQEGGKNRFSLPRLCVIQ